MVKKNSKPKRYWSGKDGKPDKSLAAPESRGRLENIRGRRFQPPAARAIDFVSAAINNPYLREQVINLMPQIFSGAPEIKVIKKDELEPEPELTKWISDVFRTIGAYRSMQITYQDTLFYGASVKSVGFAHTLDGDIAMTEIRDLPANTFNQPYSYRDARAVSPNPLMPGICVDAGGNVIVAQTDPFTFETTVLQNATIIKQPNTPWPAGEAYCMPIYPVIAEIDGVTKALNCKVNRVGSPLVLPRITPDCVDIKEAEEWCSSFLKHFGETCGEIIPNGVELADIKIYESQGAEERLKCLTDLIAKFFNPTTTLDKDGQQVLSTSDAGKTAIWHAYITSQQEWIEEEYEKFFNQLLSLNGYWDYEVVIELKRPSVDQSEIKLRQLQLALQHNLVTDAEARDLLDTLDLPPLTPEIEAELKERSEARRPNFGGGEDVFGRRRDDYGDEDDHIPFENVSGDLEADPDIDPTAKQTPEEIEREIIRNERRLEREMRIITQTTREVIKQILREKRPDEGVTEADILG